ncbi:hypothetical protein PC129_g13426 [Phytophthora cactorum]|uniref:Tf2-1-like SH3-like domain-containing protein n=1 Tax=Phytophthora cactorum TaxID=29920 RepID=A0A329RIB6_9STRA|nr:hypothetical protein Pcac1_g24681 [Phytophthora cactorum]KAG2812495.1 hypothetical protein PC112_g15147 [Phytophthora cactorum]KAG2814071.1 hypothetical protein PC111_g14128 [Phytophthora cactorum]KAG2866102.1 hypothetical protein PC113_g3162 [Phytophthora cactorum]KAG2892325.1 hypothetical protein PC114_g16675 [Phytophthora cactorum]
MFQDALQTAVEKQKENAYKRGRKHTDSFTTGERVLLSTTGIRDSAVTNLGAIKLAPRFIGPFTVTKVIGDVYTLDIPTSLRLHPTFYVELLKKYRSSEIPSVATSPSGSATFQRDGPPPLIDASGAQRWVVEPIVDHDTRSRSSTRDGQTRELPQGQTPRGNERHYRVLWLGLSPAEDTREPCSRLVKDVFTDVVDV